MQFLERYTLDQAISDLALVLSFRKLLPLLNSKEKRIWHMSKYWGAYLRYFRYVRATNVSHYIFCIRHFNSHKEYLSFAYLSNKDLN